MKYEEKIEKINMSRKNGADESLRCPICRDTRPTESALRYHLRQQHRKKRSEVENLIGIGKDELEKKRPRLSTPPRHVIEDEIKAPIIPSSLLEDESHFLLSRGLSSCNSSKSPDRDAAFSEKKEKNRIQRRISGAAKELRLPMRKAFRLFNVTVCSLLARGPQVRRTFQF